MIALAERFLMLYPEIRSQSASSPAPNISEMLL
jgi:hypothetical protein